MELRFNGCSHLHYIQAVRFGEVVKVLNISHGRPALKFKKVSDVNESEGVKNARPMVYLLPKVELSDTESRGSREGRIALESCQSSSGFSGFDVKVEIGAQTDDASLDGMTISQMKDILKGKKRKRRNHLDVTDKNGVILTVKTEVDDEDDLLEPLIILKTKVKDSCTGKRRCVKNTMIPRDPEVVPSVRKPYLEPAPQSPSNYNSSMVVKIEDESHLYPADVSCFVVDSDVIHVDGPSEDNKQDVDCHSDRNLCIVNTSQETKSTVVPNEAHEEPITCNWDCEIYTYKEAECCVVNEVLHEKMEDDVFWNAEDAGFSVVDHLADEEARISSLLVPEDPIEATQIAIPMNILKCCDTDSVTGDMIMSLKGSDLSSEVTSSTTLQPNEDSMIQCVDKIRESLHLNHETIAVTTSHCGSSSDKLEHDIQNSEVQLEDGCSTTIYSTHETSSMGVCSGTSSSGEHLPETLGFRDGEVWCEEKSRDDLHSSHEISVTCLLCEGSPYQELHSDKQYLQNTESLIVDRGRERLQSSHQTSDTGIFREMSSVSEPDEQNCQDYASQFEDSCRESLQSSHKACATETPIPSSNSAENPIVLASSGLCSPPYNSAVDIMDGLSHVKVCEDAEINKSADAPWNAIIDATKSTELVNNDHKLRLQQHSGWLFCARKVISPKSQERLRKLLGSTELCDDKNYPQRKLIFQKHMETENSRVPSNKVKRAELPASPNQFYRKQKNHTRRLLPQEVHKTPPFSVATPSVNSIHGSAESAIAFSQRQMKDMDSLASKLMNELNVMKDIIEENICSGNNLVGRKTYTPDEMRGALDNALKVKETARKWLSMMARDCNRFCQIMRSTDGSAVSGKGVNRERKKIVFADEAGGKLCQVKYIEDKCPRWR